MANDNIPSVDPADADDFTGAFRHIFNKLMQNTDDMLPAKVISYDRASNRATIQPLISLITTSGKSVARASVASVPVFQYGGGGFLISFPVKAGDLGWIKANDRDISLFAQTGGQTHPNTLRKKSFSDGMFFPDVMRGYSITDTDNLVIQSLDGTTKISVGTDGVEVTGTNFKYNGKKVLTE